MSEPSTCDSIRYFGDYLILGEIARGGMGVVYLARQTNLNREVALKLIRAGVLASRRDIEQFRVEAEAAAALSHANIVRIYESGEHEGQPFVAMELIDGSSLAEQLSEGAWSFTPATATARQRRIVETISKLADAVHHAHQHGVIHRDLKPSNLLLNTAGEPFLTDFGLAKLMHGGTELTQTGQVLGTPSYMSPEQAAGKSKDVTTASDVYGLGAILYSMLTGEPPFRGATDIETLDLVRHREPRPPRSFNAAVDPDLETICLKCLEKEPAHRYASAQALSDELQCWLRGEPIAARPVSVSARALKWIRRHPLTATLIAAIAISLLTGAAAVTWQWRRAEAGWRTVAGANVRLLMQRAEDAFQKGDSALALATLARALRDSPSNRAVEERLVNALHSRMFWLPATNVPTSAEVEEFGYAINYQAALRLARRASVSANATNAENIKVVGIDGQNSVRIFSPPKRGVIRNIALSPDVNSLAAAVADVGVCLWNLRSGQLAPLLEHPAAVNAVDFSVTVPLLATGGADGIVRLWNTTSFQLIREVRAHRGPVSVVRFNPGASMLITGGDDGVIRSWAADSLKPTGEPRSLGAPVEDVHFSSGLNRLFVRTRGTVIQSFTWTLPSQPDHVTATLPTPSLEAIPVVLGVAATNFHESEITFTNLSPDGLRLATASTDQTAGLWDTGTRRRLTEWLLHSSVVNCVRFSPDGLRVVTASADQHLRVWDVNSGAPLTDWLEADGPVFSASFSTNGWQVIASNGEAWPVYQRSGRQPDWLPELAEAVAGLRFNGLGVREKISQQKAAESCRRLAFEQEEDLFRHWLQPLSRPP